MYIDAMPNILLFNKQDTCTMNMCLSRSGITSYKDSIVAILHIQNSIIHNNFMLE